jgi:hypothetical protein
MPRRWWSAVLVALLVVPAPAMARSPHLDQLKRLYADLTIDQPLDRDKLDRLIQVALEDDLVIDVAEKALLEGFIAKGYEDPTGDGPPEIETTFPAPLKGWAKRAQTLLVTMLHSSVTSRRGGLALKELVAIAYRDDLSADDRQAILTLVDNYRQVDTKQTSRDVLEALTLIVADPVGARQDREHQRQLELLDRLTNRPNLWLSPGQASPAPGTPPIH